MIPVQNARVKRKEEGKKGGFGVGEEVGGEEQDRTEW